MAPEPGGGERRERRARRRAKHAARLAAAGDAAVVARRLGFVLAGVQKAGTSTLFSLLGDHPQVARPAQKETHYFDDDQIDWSAPDHDWYSAKARWTPEARIAGEATPAYLFWPQALERVRAYNPEMLLLLTFRDPVERAFSHWAMLKGRKADRPGFDASVRSAWATTWPRTTADVGRRSDGTIVSRGLYAAQLEHALTLFDRDHLLLLDFHRMFDDLHETLDRCTDFLGVDRFAPHPEPRNERSVPTALSAAPPSEATVQSLVDLYAEDLRRFGTLSGLAVDAWPTAMVADGRLSAGDLAARLALRAGLTAPA